MNKTEFLDILREKLAGLPADEINARISFYSEMIDDRIEDGVLEEAAVWHLGNIDDIAEQIISEVPFKKLVKNRVKRHRRLNNWEVALIIVGFPVWLPVVLSLVAVVFALYLSIWSIIVSLYASFGALAASGCGGVVGGIIIACQGNTLSGAALIGISIACAGVSIFAFYGCKMATKGLILLTKKAAIAIKNLFIKKEAK